jgi:hypothetical protein
LLVFVLFVRFVAVGSQSRRSAFHPISDIAGGIEEWPLSGVRPIQANGGFWRIVDGAT